MFIIEQICANWVVCKEKFGEPDSCDNERVSEGKVTDLQDMHLQKGSQ